MLQISSNSKPPLLRNYIFYQFYTIVSFTLILGNVFSSFCRVTVDSTTVGGGPMFKNRFISGDGCVQHGPYFVSHALNIFWNLLKELHMICFYIRWRGTIRDD